MNYAIRYIIPDVEQETRKDFYRRPFYLEWQSEYNLSRIVPPPENIRFDHDPDWQNHFLSIQSARDGNHWAWRAGHIVARVGPILWL